jgi:hypothetical protein
MFAHARDIKRVADPSARQDVEQEQRDQLILSLLEPYKADLVNVTRGRSKTFLGSDPPSTNLSDAGPEWWCLVAHGQTVTFEATVSMPAGVAGLPALTAAGLMSFELVRGGGRRVIGKVPLTGQKAVLAIAPTFLHPGDTVVDAVFEPQDPNILGSRDSLHIRVQFTKEEAKYQDTPKSPYTGCQTCQNFTPFGGSQAGEGMCRVIYSQGTIKAGWCAKFEP